MKAELPSGGLTKALIQTKDGGGGKVMWWCQPDLETNPWSELKRGIKYDSWNIDLRNIMNVGLFVR